MAYGCRVNAMTSIRYGLNTKALVPEPNFHEPYGKRALAREQRLTYHSKQVRCAPVHVGMYECVVQLGDDQLSHCRTCGSCMLVGSLCGEFSSRMLVLC
jgi:hypothetical protein